MGRKIELSGCPVRGLAGSTGMLMVLMGGARHRDSAVSQRQQRLWVASRRPALTAALLFTAVSNTEKRTQNRKQMKKPDAWRRPNVSSLTTGETLGCGLTCEMSWEIYYLYTC